VKATVEELPENRVRIDVEVPEADVKHALEHAASDLAASARVPGFRKGKAPVQVVAARIGREALWQEALRGHLDGWFWSAATSSGVTPVTSPEVEFDELPGDDGPFRFRATVTVMPKPEIGDWHGLEVPAEEAEVPQELVERELDAVRSSVAELVPVDRPVVTGDTVVVDLVGEKSGTQRDYVAEVGSGRLLEELEESLVGMSAGETKTVAVPVDEQETTDIDLTVKEIKEKVLPPLDDDLARTASEFETLEELRAGIEARFQEAFAAESDARFREAAVDAVLGASKVDVPQALVDRRAAELWAGMARSLERRGVSAETYLTMTGQSSEQIVERLRAEAEQALKRELVLDAVAEKLEVEVPDDEVEAFVREQSEAAGDDPAEMLRALREGDGFESLRADLRLKKALDEIASGVERIPVELANAREKLWTPEKEKAESGLNIWTPGSEEAPKR
jgi:trigger factor